MSSVDLDSGLGEGQERGFDGRHVDSTGIGRAVVLSDPHPEQAVRVPVVGCIVVNYFKEELTENCIRSLAAAANKVSIECMVVDNGSHRKLDFGRLQATNFRVKTITPGRNLGFADGCNLAAGLLLAGSVRYLMLLNNDAEVEPDTIARLLEGIETSPDICAVTGKIRYEDADRSDCWYAGARFSRLTGRPYHCSSEAERFDSIDKDGMVSAVPFISGCCLLARADLVRKHGLFRGGLFAYGEDLDWCLRMTALRYRLGYVASAIVTHQPSSSFRSDTGKTIPLAHFLSARNLLYVNRLHLRGVRKACAMTSNIGRSLVLALAFVVAGRVGKGIVTTQAVWCGVFSELPPVGESERHDYGIPGRFGFSRCELGATSGD